MSEDRALSGAEWLARTLVANGTTHVFFMDAVLRRTLIELGTLGVARTLAHSEKSAAYMADGYARIAGRPGICFAQSVGAVNLAAGLQDAWLGRSPVIALTGRKPLAHQHRNAYQEIPHALLYAAVTKLDAMVEETADLPRLLRHAWRATMTETPRPTHLDLNGLQAEIIETGLVHAAGSLGWAFPAALGAKCAAPHRKVICWSGDGALYYHATELETAHRRGIAIVLVVNNNSGFGQGWPNIQRMQLNKPGDVAELMRFGPTNFADVARAFGVRAIRVDDPARIAPALRVRRMRPWWSMSSRTSTRERRSRGFQARVGAVRPAREWSAACKSLESKQSGWANSRICSGCMFILIKV